MVLFARSPYAKSYASLNMRTSYGKSYARLMVHVLWHIDFQEFQEMLKRSGRLMESLMRGLMRSYGEALAAICPDPVQILMEGRGTHGWSLRWSYAKPYAP